MSAKKTLSNAYRVEQGFFLPIQLFPQGEYGGGSAVGGTVKSYVQISLQTPAK